MEGRYRAFKDFNEFILCSTGIIYKYYKIKVEVIFTIIVGFSILFMLCRPAKVRSMDFTISIHEQPRRN